MTSATLEAPRRGRGRPAGATTEQSIMPIYEAIPVALICGTCGEFYGEYDAHKLPRARLYCGRCNHAGFRARVWACDAAPRTIMGHTMAAPLAGWA